MLRRYLALSLLVSICASTHAQDGTLVSTFPSGGAGPNNSVYASAVQDDGKIVIGGNFSMYNGVSRPRVARINADGSLDATFTPVTGANGTVWDIAASGSSFYIVGSFTTYNGAARHRVARVNSNGTVDASFTTGSTGANNIVRAVGVQSDGKVIIGGDFTDYNGTPVNRIARLNTDGTLDNSFMVGTGLTARVRSLIVQPDNKIILSGDFNSYNGTSRNRFLRLNADGTIDPSFTIGFGSGDYTESLALQNDGKILLGGAAKTYNGTARNHIARTNANGTLDTGFDPVGGAAIASGTGTPWVRAIEVQNDGKILLGGDFTLFNGASHVRIVRLNANGSVDAGFTSGSGFTIPTSATGAAVRTIRVLNSGDILVGGDFQTYNGVSRGYLALLEGSAASEVMTGTVGASFCAGSSLTVPYTVNGTFNMGNTFTAQLSDANGSFAMPVSIGSVTATASGTIAATLPAGASGNGYRIRIVSSSPVTTGTNNGSDIQVAGTEVQPVPNMTVCAGTAVPMTAFSGSGNYTWTNDNPMIGLAASGAGNLPAFTAMNSGAMPQVAIIQVSANEASCPAKPTTFRITVKPMPVMNAIAAQSVCAGTQTSSLVFSGTAGALYRWTNSNTDIGLGSVGTGSIAAFTAMNGSMNEQVTGTISVTPVLNGCSGMPVMSTITVTRSAGALSYPQASYCGTGWAYARVTGTGGGSFSAMPSGLLLDAGTGAVNLALSMPGTYTVSYMIGGATGACASMASTQLTVLPQATVNPVPNQVYCDGMMTAPISFSGTASGYAWTNDNTAIGLAASGTGTIPTFMTTNPGPGSISASIRVRPLGDGASSCPGKVRTFRFTVNDCPPVTISADTEGNGDNTRMAPRLGLSPNPAASQVTVSLSGSSRHAQVLQLLTQGGQPAGAPVTFTGNRVIVPLTGLRPGIYFVQVTDTGTGRTLRGTVVKL
ncbi:hypothetical protein [Flaviaesturariibacter amylovorans]|uniref:T9SS type A sorting domain-containing protein n=1 Tax=Flaviaesturariibacter amylovorans TaxID=1084520 RepID=A0ABP8GIG1_9BACT